MSETVQVIRTEYEGVVEVRLNRPDKMNALDTGMFTNLANVGEKLKKDPTLRAVVISGEGRCFCAGLDMGNFSKMAEGGGAGGSLVCHLSRTDVPPTMERERRNASFSASMASSFQLLAWPGVP